MFKSYNSSQTTSVQLCFIYQGGHTILGHLNNKSAYYQRVIRNRLRGCTMRNNMIIDSHIHHLQVNLDDNWF